MNWGIINLWLGLLIAGGLSAVWWIADASHPPGEICDNGLDDDADGLIDLNDPDCACASVEPISLIPNPSFEERSCCPRNHSQLSCADTWIQASEATTDYLHMCGWTGWDYIPTPFPFPDGEGCVGFRNGRFATNEFTDVKEPNFKEYAGACLLSPLRANNTYLFRFYIGFSQSKNSPPTEVTFFGTTDCSNLPFGVGNREFGCPSNDPNWKLLASVGASGNMNWVQREVTITPREDIYAIAVGPTCRELSGDEDIYYFFDNLLLADQKAFEFQITEHGNPCVDTFSMTIPAYDTLQYQWYRNGVAIPGATSARLRPVGPTGNYQVRITSPQGCKLTNDYFFERPAFYEEQEAVICHNEYYQFHSQTLWETGVYTETLKSVEHCDSVIQLSLRVTDDKVDSIAVKLFEGETLRVGAYNFAIAGEHLAYLTTNIGCDSTVHIDLEYYHVYIPSAFSPNDDGVNDTFSIFGNEDLLTIQSMRIFNRWGQLMYEGSDLAPDAPDLGWNGKTRLGVAPDGVYIYSIDLLMEDGQVRNKKGSVTLIR
ncbi:MAG: gliding motility-associated C-terminal domain-containing protein [Saprospiraceae bacterium]|nr:gliding motility-associated C-terminal domain-containing protein [Lewinella sp.]